MEIRAKRRGKYPLFSLSPLIIYPSFLFLLFLFFLLTSALLIKSERKTSSNFLHLLGINTPKDILFLLLIIIAAIFVLMVLILSLVLLPPSLPLPA